MHAGLPLLEENWRNEGVNRSFFHYLMTLRGGGAHDTLSIFATEAGKRYPIP